MVRLIEKPRAPAIATEQQRSLRLARARLAILLQEHAQVLIGAGGIADVKLHRLPDAHRLGDGDGAGGLFNAANVAHQKIAALEGRLKLIYDPADVQALLHELPVARAKLLPHELELRQRRLSPQFLDDVVARLGDDERLADRPAALRDDAAARDRPLQERADGAFEQCLFALDQ